MFQGAGYKVPVCAKAVPPTSASRTSRRSTRTQHRLVSCSQKASAFPYLPDLDHACTSTTGLWRVCMLPPCPADSVRLLRRRNKTGYARKIMHVHVQSRQLSLMGTESCRRVKPQARVRLCAQGSPPGSIIRRQTKRHASWGNTIRW